MLNLLVGAVVNMLCCRYHWTPGGSGGSREAQYNGIQPPDTSTSHHDQNASLGSIYDNSPSPSLQPVHLVTEPLLTTATTTFDTWPELLGFFYESRNFIHCPCQWCHGLKVGGRELQFSVRPFQIFNRGDCGGGAVNFSVLVKFPKWGIFTLSNLNLERNILARKFSAWLQFRVSASFCSAVTPLVPVWYKLLWCY